MLKVLTLAGAGSHRFLGFLVWVGLAFPMAAQQNLAVYTDSLQSGWNDWSWGSTINFGNTSPVHSGSDSTAITITNGYAGLYLEHAAFDSTPYTNVSFWVNGGAGGGQSLAVRATLGGVVTGSQVQLLPKRRRMAADHGSTVVPRRRQPARPGRHLDSKPEPFRARHLLRG